MLLRLINRVQGWQGTMLSYVGRRELTQTVLKSIQTFWASIFFFIPKGVIGKIQQICQRFLWSGVMEGTGMKLVAWDQVCQQLDHGGLGFKEILS